jgi:hypothetical protein
MRHLGLAGHAHQAWRTPQRATVSPIGGPCAALFHLAEIACGNFSGHYFVDRRLRPTIVHDEIADGNFVAWFLPAAAVGDACGAHAGNSSEC